MKLSMPSIPSILKADDYPLPAFQFKVVLSATLGLADTSFQEVTGIGSEIDNEEYVEGGENRYVHNLPKAVKHPKLVLKRGVAKLSSPLVIWCKSVLETDFILPIVPMPLLVFLMNEKGMPNRVWTFANAYPVNWEVEAFNSTKNEVAIEKIELRYNYSNRML
ncbi:MULTISPECIES: phage tail protein [unclassified Colwellia]|uniref:phage tail protein n=1 Tax=unclassified Colwellia TaxID=196834 RepID=UPI00217528DB|nr:MULTISPECIES: phage tail protein [unclassified Colwellia]